jgi:hypothetical protein
MLQVVIAPPARGTSALRRSKQTDRVCNTSAWAKWHRGGQQASASGTALRGAAQSGLLPMEVSLSGRIMTIHLF